MNARAADLTVDDAPSTGVVDPVVERLYREHHVFVWRNARRLGCADEWVDDAVQEVFLVAARRLGELSAESNVRGWLFAIVFRIAARMQRDRARYRARLQRYTATGPETTSASPEARSHAAAQLRQLLLELDEVKRVVVILVELEGMTSAEVSRVLSVPQGTVDSRLRAARKQLQDLIARERASETGQQP